MRKKYEDKKNGKRKKRKKNDKEEKRMKIQIQNDIK